jgi:septal ring factor EnvC (AmiA/AmiB activator)
MSDKTIGTHKRCEHLDAPITLFLILLLGLIACAALADEDDSTTISRIRRELESERFRLDSLTTIKRSELDQLSSLDNQLELTSQLLFRLNRRLDHLSTQEDALVRESAELDSALQRQKMRLAVSLRKFYMRRRQAPDLLASSTDIRHFVNQITYTRRSAESLRNMIDLSDSLIEQAGHRKLQLADTRSQVTRYLKEKNLEEKLLRVEHSRRGDLMDRIREEEALYRKHLKQLEDEARSTDSLFASTLTSDDASLFELQKGNLPYPIKGRIISGFGPQRDERTGTVIVSRGIEIKGELGSPVCAAYDGLVHFRGYLRGYGNVLIVDHGSGWYTLYAHLSGFAVDSGSAVKAGQAIGYLGDSDVKDGPSLHFQIRHKKEQLDPVEWLRR